MIELEGGCYVTDIEDLKFSQNGAWQEATVIDRSKCAKALSQYFIRVSKGETPIRSYPHSDVVLYVIDGSGEVTISGRSFPIKPETGIYVKPSEAFSFTNSEGNPIEILATVCPECKSPKWLKSMPENFDTSHNKRTVGISERNKTATGDRFYQLMVGKKMGSGQVTQFIGSVPKSKAPDHYHLYEEAITILSGKGYMWTGNSKTPVKKGSMIFLPKKQSHCMECIVDQSLKLMGVFYPAGSPKINYKG